MFADYSPYSPNLNFVKVMATPQSYSSVIVVTCLSTAGSALLFSAAIGPELIAPHELNIIGGEDLFWIHWIIGVWGVINAKNKWQEKKNKKTTAYVVSNITSTLNGFKGESLQYVQNVS